MQISRVVQAKILMRSFFIQGAWNFKGMQNIGFTYAMLPGLKAIHGKDSTSLNKSLRRYFTFFNTQPYMAPTIMGACLNKEAAGDTTRIEDLQHTMESTLAAIGDTFFWQDLKPITSLVSILFIMLGHAWGIALAFIVFNVIHIWTMIGGFKLSLRDGIQGVLKLGKRLTADIGSKISYIIPFLVGLSIVILPVYSKGTINAAWIWLCFPVFLILHLIRVNSFWLFYAMSITVLLLSVMV
ncbi:MAG: hypothetical protein DRG37_02795 [Deltaproteobacteria bacterium]|nr:MAG: hypothetical protein DRG37_02795 [Deltaproteobacteria bacterium]